jgi:hypothetical protein
LHIRIKTSSLYKKIFGIYIPAMSTRDNEVSRLEAIRLKCRAAFIQARTSFEDKKISEGDLRQFEIRFRNAEFDLRKVRKKCERCFLVKDIYHDTYSDKWFCQTCTAQIGRERVHAKAREMAERREEYEKEKRDKNLPPEFDKCDECRQWTDQSRLTEEGTILCDDCLWEKMYEPM